MTTVKATKKICMEPRALGPKLKEKIIERLNNDMTGQCDQEYGYILGIEEDIKILDNKVTPAGKGVFFDVEFTIETLKPVVGNEFTGIVCMVFEQGIFIEVEGKMKVLIPADKMSGYRYSKSKEYFKNGSTTVSKDDKVSGILEKIKYENQNFSCIGSLKTL